MSDRFEFAGYELHLPSRALKQGDRRVPLGSRATDVLLALLERPGELVTKDELLDRAWPGLVVEEANVQVQISGIRKALGSGVITTVPGLGYRFVAEVARRGAPVAGAEAPGTGRAERANPGVDGVPDRTGALLGRDRDVEALCRWVNDNPLVTLIGAGGIGKTRVARAVASRSASAFRNGACWVDLSTLSSAEHLEASIASAGALRLDDQGSTPTEALITALGGRELLLVLDNCEHLAESVGALIHAVAEALPAIRFLVTTQELLKVGVERVYRLGPLGIAPPGTTCDRLPSFSSAQLLLQRARMVDRRFELTPENTDATVELLRRLEGLPLAIEMAAAWMPKLGPNLLLARLSHWLALLRGPLHGVPDRQKTLRATLDWSHSLLDEPEQAVLRRLSMFSGTFRVDLACDVGRDDSTDDAAVLDALSGLVDKSLVQIESIQPLRYRLLETTRIYAGERLVHRNEVGATRTRYGRAMTQLAREIETSFWGMSDIAWLSRYGPEYGELQVNFDRACADADADAAAQIGAALQRMDHLRSINASRKRRAERLYALLDKAGPESKALIWMCITSHNMIPLDVVTRLEAAGRAVEAWRALAEPVRLHFALGFLANERARLHDFAGADDALAEASALESPDWPVRRRMWAASARAGVCISRGDARGYREWCSVELALASEAGADRTAANARLKLADAALMAGDLEEAIALGESAVATLRDLDQPATLGLALSNLCAALLLSGRRAPARHAAAEALPLLWRNGWGHLLLDSVALIAAQEGRAEDAACLLGYTAGWYSAHQDLRQPNEARLASIAEAAAAARVGTERVEAAKARGSAFSDAQAESLAGSLCLAGPVRPELAANA